MRSVSIVLPCHNEAENIGPVVEAATSALAVLAAPIEIIIVDDGSTDATWEAVGRLASERPGVVGLRLSRNFGKEAAIAAGLDAAAGDAIIIMDADLQHPPALLAAMFGLWAAGGADVVEAVKAGRGDEPLTYGLMARLFYRVLNALSGFDLRGASDFKLLDRKVVEAWRAFPERNLFFRGLVSWMGFRVVRVPFAVSRRRHGRSSWTLARLVDLAVTGILAYSYIPLRVITMLGGLFLLFAAILGTRALVIKFTHQVLDGITLLILINLVIGSVIMISLGIIGEYVANIYKEIKARPRYIVSERV